MWTLEYVRESKTHKAKNHPASIRLQHRFRHEGELAGVPAGEGVNVTRRLCFGTLHNAQEQDREHRVVETLSSRSRPTETRTQVGLAEVKVACQLRHLRHARRP